MFSGRAVVGTATDPDMTTTGSHGGSLIKEHAAVGGAAVAVGPQHHVAACGRDGLGRLQHDVTRGFEQHIARSRTGRGVQVCVDEDIPAIHRDRARHGLRRSDRDVGSVG